MESKDHIHDEIVAYLEGELTAEQAARVEESLRASDEYRREYEWLSAVYSTLENAGRAFDAKAPQIDLADAVLAEVFKIERQPKVVAVPKPGAQPKTQKPWWKRAATPFDWGMVAAFAAIALTVGYFLFADQFFGGGNSSNSIAKNGSQTQNATTGPKSGGIAEDSRRKLEQAQEMRKLASSSLSKHASPSKSEGVFESTSPPPTDGRPTITDIVSARRDAAGGGAGLAKLVEWATLKREEAQRVIDSPDASPLATVAAADSLSQADEEQVLLTAVGMLPEDPYARFELAKSLSEDPQKTTEAMAQLQAMPDLDQDNALPYYLKAKLLLEQGDAAGALEALAVAQSKRTVSAYTRESAQANVQALIAAGVPEDQAKLLSAVTAGSDQYSYLTDLGKTLIDYGRNYMASQDYETAQELFDAARTLGSQVQDGASFSQEQLAGLDIQSQAIDALQELYSQTGSTEEIEALANQTLDLVASIEGLDGIFTALQQLFTTDYGEDIWNTVSGLVLSYGDVNIFQYLSQMGITIPGAPN
ncbi:MAG: hypothetical protein K1Y02_13030 [Candidatus Hydrogenedentes bacterium]|nr:hypothetical protein [Candidatus Hydrogenedentota bacterium]